jgi:hypothetical protein
MKKSLISPLFFVALPIYVVIAIALERAKADVAFADQVNRGIAQSVRRFMATLTSSVSFSIFEVLVISLPLIAFIVIFVAVRRFRRGEGRVRLISALLAIIMLLLSGNTLCLGFGYRTTSLRKNLGLEYETITEKKVLYDQVPTSRGQIFMIKLKQQDKQNLLTSIEKLNQLDYVWMVSPVPVVHLD